MGVDISNPDIIRLLKKVFITFSIVLFNESKGMFKSGPFEK